MVCPHCSHDTRVFNSRVQKRSNSVWRRRQCTFCDVAFTTIEAIDYSKQLLVRSSNSRELAPFERDRLLLSLHKSLQHRPTALADAGALCTTIISKLAVTAQQNELPRERIIQTCLVALRRFDTLAAQHYQAFHRE